MISFESPLGKGLIGRSVGDVSRLQLPGGVKEVEILEVFIGYRAEEPGEEA